MVTTLGDFVYCPKGTGRPKPNVLFYTGDPQGEHYTVKGFDKDSDEISRVVGGLVFKGSLSDHLGDALVKNPSKSSKTS